MSEENKEPILSPEPDTPSDTPEAPPPAEDRPLTRGQQRRRQRSVFQYITILFAAAFVLLLFTFMMEKRQYELLQQQSEEQIDDLQQSVSAVQSLQKLYDENDRLKEQLQKLEDELERLQTQYSEASHNAQIYQDSVLASNQSLAALDWFWQVNEAYVRGKYSLCRDLMEEMELRNLVSYLPTESVTNNQRFSPYDRYQEIYEAVN